MSLSVHSQGTSGKLKHSPKFMFMVSQRQLIQNWIIQRSVHPVLNDEVLVHLGESSIVGRLTRRYYMCRIVVVLFFCWMISFGGWDDQRIGDILGEVPHPLFIHRVRLVAPGKWMLCASFRLPAQVALSKTSETWGSHPR
jgi:hypothetical protein